MFTTILGLVATLGALDTDLEPQPKTVESAARIYRIQVYETFRKDRGEYDRRIAVGEQVWKAWTDAGETSDIRGQFVQWYEDAQDVSRSDNVAELPSTALLPHILVSTPAGADQEQDATQEGFQLEDTINLDGTGTEQPSAGEGEGEGDSTPFTTLTAPLGKSEAMSALGRSLLQSIKVN